MYKTHITKWELDKRNKEHEVMAIVRKKCQRDAVGKSSEFHIRGRLVSIEDVHRYLKRKGMSVEDAIARRAASPLLYAGSCTQFPYKPRELRGASADSC
jgi:hypothetical protein